ncbi:hypothetical protein GCM10010124_08880 [Pilimelia terevasa]|uniref:Uncharacterized protein n=1 Tax=Pilimelia terevasa TaxID=53372 RepID=A0A8J3BFW1_9ACTN|nr:hypothetical protein [Pilimelia terevasa]GGK18502.1 hypothetical protein GCM10010124_08880 [Pilimelia terevasa]
MTTPPALAWGAARAFVTASETGAHYVWLVEQVNRLLGPDYRRALAQTRHRVVYPRHYDARLTEADAWRIRLERVLERRPHLVGELRELFVQVDSRLASSVPDWRGA